MKRLSIAVLPGDGIGPEVIAQAVRVLEAVGERFDLCFDFATYPIGAAGVGGQPSIAGGDAPRGRPQRPCVAPGCRPSPVCWGAARGAPPGGPAPRAGGLE